MRTFIHEFEDCIFGVPIGLDQRKRMSWDTVSQTWKEETGSAVDVSFPTVFNTVEAQSTVLSVQSRGLSAIYISAIRL
jgi:hypothetical protein